jgi:hypothetical protein
MNRTDAVAELAVSGYTRDSATRLLDRAASTGAGIARGVRVTWSERYGYRVRRATAKRAQRRASRGFAS